MDDWDFGFTAVTEEELEVVQSAAKDVAGTQDRLDKLYNAIIPLLNNLKKNPEKEHIYWPNREDKVNEFQEALEKIYKG